MKRVQNETLDEIDGLGVMVLAEISAASLPNQSLQDAVKQQPTHLNGGSIAPC